MFRQYVKQFIMPELVYINNNGIDLSEYDFNTLVKKETGTSTIIIHSNDDLKVLKLYNPKLFFGNDNDKYSEFVIRKNVFELLKDVKSNFLIRLLEGYYYKGSIFEDAKLAGYTSKKYIPMTFDLFLDSSIEWLINSIEELEKLIIHLSSYNLIVSDLDLENNVLTNNGKDESGMEKLLEALKTNTMLISLNISNNHLTSNIGSEIIIIFLVFLFIFFP